MTNPLRHLYQFIADHYNEKELRELCSSLGVDHDHLQGDKAQALVLHLREQGRLNELLAKLRMEALYAALPVTKAAGDARADSESATTHIFPNHLQQLITSLKDSNPDSRWRTAYALGRIGDQRAVGPLIEALDDEDERVRQKAAEALHGIGTPQALAAVKEWEIKSGLD
jgi:hypothetical protein